MALLGIVAAFLGGPFVSAGSGEIAQMGNLRVTFQGGIAPVRLPRTGAAPIAVEIGGRISTTDGSEPPQLRQIEIAINRAGRLDRRGLPVCHFSDIQPSTTENALLACGGARVGEGSFSATVTIPEQTPFPSSGRVIAFNGTMGGKPVIFAHVYGTEPVPTSYTLPLLIEKTPGGFSTTLTGSLPAVTGDAAFVTGLELRLQRRFRFGGQTRSFLSAGCPAPSGFSTAIFPLARASFGFDGGASLSSTLVRNCRVR